ncbi:hypothetical protein ACFLXI_00440 [Chloroflexota bacterium]
MADTHNNDMDENTNDTSIDNSAYEETQQDSEPSRVTRVFWQGKFGPAFWTITGIISITVNIILIVALIIIGQQLFTLNEIVEYGLIGGLHSNFVAMDEATILTTVKVEDTIPVKFDLPVQTNTTVVLTEPTPIRGASVVINTSVLNINAPADIVLPAGLELPISLDIIVPVDKEVPVILTVPVNIPLNETELHEPFVGLREVVEPYKVMLGDLPDVWMETPLCQGQGEKACIFVFDLQEP